MKKDLIRLPKLIFILIFSFYRLHLAVIMLSVFKDRLFSQCSHFPPFIMKYFLSKTCALIEKRTETCAVALLLLRIIPMSVDVSEEGLVFLVFFLWPGMLATYKSAQQGTVTGEYG